MMPGTQTIDPACCPPECEPAPSLAVDALNCPADSAELMSELAGLAKALGHPARVKILCLLSNRGRICGEVVEEVGLAQSTVSQHLKVLKEVGLIQGEIAGPATCYSLNQKTLRRLRVLISAM
jgi:ArsR family transcriptional regulator